MTRSQLKTSTLGEIVSGDFRAAAILDRYGFDYCCGSARSLADACSQRGISLVEVLSELEALDPGSRGRVEDDPAALVDYIVSRQHIAAGHTSAPREGRGSSRRQPPGTWGH